MDYLLNVLMSTSPYLAIFIVLLGFNIFMLGPRSSLAKILKTDTINRVRLGLKVVASSILVFGVAVSVFSPSNTPKNTLSVPQRAMSSPTSGKDTEVVDRTRAPAQTAAERKESFDKLTNYKKD